MATSGKPWQVGICDCWSPASSCLGACCCPCFYYGNTQQLRENPHAEPSNCSGTCCLWFAIAEFTGLQCVLQCLNRGDMRKEYGIAGNTTSDCCISCWCMNCALVQERKEVLHQNALKSGGGHGVGGVTAQPAPNQGMAYTAPAPHTNVPAGNYSDQKPISTQEGYIAPAPQPAYGAPQGGYSDAGHKV